MAKHTHAAKRAPVGSDTDRALVNRVFSQLRIPGSQNLAQWRSRCLSELDSELLARWDALRDQSSAEFYDLSHRDLPTSMLLSAGLRSDLGRQELMWLLSRLRRDTAGRESPLIAEVGCGSGVAAAIVSLALNVTVVAIDESPAAVSVTTAVARVLGAQVDAHVGRAEDLTNILDGSRADAIFLFSTMRYVQPHKHGHESKYYSWSQHLQAISEEAKPTVECAAMLEALDPDGGLYFSDVECIDRTAELEGCVAPSGRHLALADYKHLSGHVVGREETHGAFACTPDASAPTGLQLFERFAGVAPQVRVGTRLTGIAAERARMSLDGLELIRAVELTFPGYSYPRRSELSRGPGYVLTYRAEQSGLRELSAFPTRELARILAEYDEPVPGVCEKQLGVGAEAW